MHLDIEALERLLHDELDPRQGAEARRHLDACPECRERLADARRREDRIFGLLEALDHEPPAARPAWSAGTSAEREPARDRPAWQRLAASVAFVVAAGGVLYALPGSPLREWIAGPDADERGTVDRDSSPRENGAEELSGLSALPEGPYEIAFSARQSSGGIRVELSSAPEVRIRIVGEPVGLESGPDRLIVSNAGSRSSYEIRLPADGPAVTLLLAGETVFRKEGDRVETPSDPDPSGAYRIDLSSPPR
jgi:hypothetical protein